MPKPNRKARGSSPGLTIARKRILAVSCSHGQLIDPRAADAVIRFRQRYKPHVVVHLGDFIDTACWRSGSRGTADETRDPIKDVEAGMRFLQELGVTHLCMGNHDERPYRFLETPNAVIRYAAEQAVQGMEFDLKKRNIEFCNEWSVWKWFEFGNFKFMHGYMFNENAARDHAEAHGNVVFGHTHTSMVQKGRRDDSPTGINVGTLSLVENHDYSKARRKSLSHSQAFAWGEFNDHDCQLWLHENGRPGLNRPWVLPG